MTMPASLAASATSPARAGSSAGLPGDLPADAEAAQTATDDAHTVAAQHVRLMLFGVIARLIGQVTTGGESAALAAHPFLADYQSEIRAQVGTGPSPWRAWADRVRTWESECAAHLPLRALRDAGLSALDLELLLVVGLVEEDPRFALLFSEGVDASAAPRWPTVEIGRAHV